MVPSATSGSLITESIDENSTTISSAEEHEHEHEQQMEEQAEAQASKDAADASGSSAGAGADAPAGSASIAIDLGASSDSSDDDRVDSPSASSKHATGAGAEEEEEEAVAVVYKNVHKRPYIASELLCAEIGSVVDVLVEDERLLTLLFSLLSRPPPLDPSTVSYFRKVLQVLIQRKYAELVSFCAARGVLDALLRHLGLYSVLELIIMLGWDSGLSMEGQIEQRWMLGQGLIPKLVRRLHPQFQALPDVHAHAGRLLVDVVVKCPLAHASPLVEHLSTTPILQALLGHMFSGCASSLSNSLSVVIVLVQRFANRRMEQLEQHAHAGTPDDFVAAPCTNEWNAPGDYAVAAALAPDEADRDCLAEKARLDAELARRKRDGLEPATAGAGAIAGPSQDPEVLRLGEPFVSLLPHLPRILDLLKPEPPAAPSAAAAAAASASASASAAASAAASPSSSSSSSTATASAAAPSATPSLSQPMSIPGVLGSPSFGSLRMKVIELCLVLARSRSAHIDALLASLGVAQEMLRVFFAYPWNNLLHGLVESIATSALEEPESALTRAFFATGPPPPPPSADDAAQGQSQQQGRALEESGPGLVDSFIGAWEANEAAVRGGEMRRGYMGHLIRTAATVDHMLHSMAAEQRASLLGPAEGPTAARWDRFVGETLSRELTAQQSEESAALESVLGDMGMDAMGMGMGDMGHGVGGGGDVGGGGGLTPSDSHHDLQQSMSHQSQRSASGYGSLSRYLDDDDDDEEEEDDSDDDDDNDHEHRLDDDDLDLGFNEPAQQQQQQRQQQEHDDDDHEDEDGQDGPHSFERRERMEALMEEAAALAADADADADAQLAHTDM